jgi:serine-type D-Ala-D-Ala carboxypeptidase (penicillin-binding protein 5/6)
VRRFLAAVAVTAALASSATAAPPTVQSAAYRVEGDVDGAVLAQRAAAQPRAIASITKLMTVLVALEHADLDDLVTVAPQAAAVGESTAGLHAGERLTVRDLVAGTLVPSGNDAATALALFVGDGSLARFVALMNAKAAALGMRDSHFANPTGLDEEGHHSSARDTVALLRAALAVPIVKTLAASRSATITGGRELRSTDDLLGAFAGFEGGKTGHTNDAGWSQVAAAHRDGARVLVSVLGATTEDARDGDLEALLRWGLAQYRPVRAVDDERAYAEVAVGYGVAPLELVAAREIVRPARVDRPLLERVVAPTAAALPVRAGQRLGEVRILDGDRVVARAPLVAERSVEEPGAGAKVRWYGTRTVHHLLGFVS